MMKRWEGVGGGSVDVLRGLKGGREYECDERKGLSMDVMRERNL
jgi:hypothetical protein